jgi:site-specific recombinase XerD
MIIRTRACIIKNERRIALLFDYNEDVMILVKQIEGRKWSASNKFWHIPLQENYLEIINKKFTGKLEFIESTKTNTEPKKTFKNHLPSEYIETLKLKNYSESTIQTYRLHFQRFLKYYKNTKLENITHEQIRQYLLYLVEKKKYSVSSQNNAINSIKFYYTQMLHQEINDYYIPRPHKSKTIPRILNEQEVSLILKSVTDLRNKCMIFLIYSAGLTPGEIQYLKPDQIDSGNMKIFISSAKGEKDRFVVLSDKVLNLLRDYFRRYKPQEWLFESRPGKQYSKRTLQKAFKAAVQKSGLTKPATLSILKNSFAVHLLERGVDIRYIQKMLGHKHSKTTMKFLKVSKRDLKAIQSPLDSLDI